MDKSIKTLGLFPIRVSLHAEVETIVTVNVARSLEEAETQARTGQAVVATEDGGLEEDQKAEVEDNADTDTISDAENEFEEVSATEVAEPNDKKDVS